MGINSLIEDAIGLVKENPVASAVGATGIAVGTGLGVAAIVKSTKRRKSKRTKNRDSRKRSNRNKRKKRNSRRSTRKIHYTKKGQPFVYLRNGKARFIKKSSAKKSKKLKGGRY